MDKKTTGMGRIVNKKNYDEENHKDSYTYRVIYNDALSLLKDIEPYLVINRKKLRAQLLLKEYKQLTPRNGIYSDELKIEKEKLYEKFMAL